MINNIARGSAYRDTQRYRRTAMRISPSEVYMNTAILGVRLAIRTTEIMTARGNVNQGYIKRLTATMRGKWSLSSKLLEHTSARLRIAG